MLSWTETASASVNETGVPVPASVPLTWPRSSAKNAGVKPGMQVTVVDDQPVEKWLEARQAELEAERPALETQRAEGAPADTGPVEPGAPQS